MPLALSSILNFFPTQIWSRLVKLLKPDSTVVSDVPFRLSSRYTPALLTVMMVLAFANQFVRTIEISCESSFTPFRTSSGGSYGDSKGGGDKVLNDHCWNYNTFIVAKALKPDYESRAIYPGIAAYEKGKDQLIWVTFYKIQWMLLVGLGVIAYLPNFLWKLRGTKRVKTLLDLADVEGDFSEDDKRVAQFLDSAGLNSSFALEYFFCKILTAVTPLAQWYLTCVVIGPLYRTYGLDVLMHYAKTPMPWPNPMDALFPKITKCEKGKAGHGQDLEIESALCDLPMNGLTQWAFLAYWWWIALVFVISVLSCLLLLPAITCPAYRNMRYSSFVKCISHQVVEQARTSSIHSIAYTPTSKRIRKSQVIHVSISLGDWLILDFLRRNIEGQKFRKFVRKLVITRNNVMQIRPQKTNIVTLNQETGNTRKSNWFKQFRPAPEIGFKKEILEGALPLDYTQFAPMSASTSLNPGEENFPTDEKDDLTIQIMSPVPLQRAEPNTKSSGKAGGSTTTAPLNYGFVKKNPIVKPYKQPQPSAPNADEDDWA